ncbi:MAG TPA: 30S ribosomal protein S3 [Candidatus Korarchaeota archaeon]|nr:30S ribosomal protein S3 [Candidatus Korarchaeota archaeon]
MRYSLHELMEKVAEKAGFHGVDISSTPVRDIITVYVERPGIIIGRGGRASKRIGEMVKEALGISNPYIQAKKVDEPFLSARIVASYIARRIARGERHKRVAFSALRRVMMAGAKGVEIRLSGKFGSQRAREERFRAGVIYRCGQDQIEKVDYAVKHVLMPQGVIGVRVRIVRPDVESPDTIKVKEEVIEKIRQGLREEREELTSAEVVGVEVPEELAEALEPASEESTVETHQIESAEGVESEPVEEGSEAESRGSSEEVSEDAIQEG